VTLSYWSPGKSLAVTCVLADVGAVLLQCKEDNKKHPIGYYSAMLNEVQHNYDIYNLKLLTIVMALRNWRPLLAGSPHKVIIYSDHLNLQYWQLPQKIS